MSDVNKNDWRDFLAHYGVKGMKWGKRKKLYQLGGKGVETFRGGWTNSNKIGEERLWQLRRHRLYNNELRKTGNYNGQKAVYQFNGKARPTSNATAKRLSAANRGNPNYTDHKNRHRDLMIAASKKIKPYLRKKKIKSFTKKSINKAKNFITGLFKRG